MQTRYDNRFLRKVKEKIVMDQVAQKRPYKRSMGKTVDFFRYLQLSPVTAHLTEGDSGSEAAITGQNVQATIKEMGAWYKPTSLLKMTSRDRNLDKYVDVAADQMAESYDLKLMEAQALTGGWPILADGDTDHYKTGVSVTTGATSDEFVSTTLVQANDYFNGGRAIFTAAAGPTYGFCFPIDDFVAATDLASISDTATYSGGSEYPPDMEQNCSTSDVFTIAGTKDLGATDIPTSTNLKYCLRVLQDNKAQPISGRYYIGILDPFTHMDLMADTNWLNVQTYKDSTKGIFKGEVGSIWGIRFIMTTQPWRQAVASYQYSATGAVHVIPIMGREALAAIDLQGQGKHMIVHNEGSKSDPLDMYSTVGWKFINAARTLNALFSVNLFCGATA
jgi:hypothetical protein